MLPTLRAIFNYGSQLGFDPDFVSWFVNHSFQIKHEAFVEQKSIPLCMKWGGKERFQACLPWVPKSSKSRPIEAMTRKCQSLCFKFTSVGLTAVYIHGVSFPCTTQGNPRISTCRRLWTPQSIRSLAVWVTAYLGNISCCFNMFWWCLLK